MSDPDGDEDMNSASLGSDDSDGSDGSDIDDNDTNDVEIQKLKQALTEHPYDYNKYGLLIGYLSKAGELDELRNIRNAFAKHFPLSSDIWLAWLADESKLASTNEEKASVVGLFEKAVKDYVSVDIWLEYCQFSLWQGTIHILRKHFYSTKLNLTTKFFTETRFFRQNKRISLSTLHFDEIFMLQLEIFSI